MRDDNSLKEHLMKDEQQSRFDRMERGRRCCKGEWENGEA